MLQVIEPAALRRRHSAPTRRESTSSEDSLSDDEHRPGDSDTVLTLDALLAQQLQQEENMASFGPLHSGDVLQETWRLLTEQLQIQFADGHSLENAASGSARPSLELIASSSGDPEPQIDAITGQDAVAGSTSIPSMSAPEPMTCGICNDEHPDDWLISVPGCTHRFCHSCLRSHVGYKLEEGRYPIFCPTCEAYSRDGYTKLEDEVFKELSLSLEHIERITQLQLLPHSVTMQCPRCTEVMEVDRADFIAEKVLVCPLRKCGHKWCKDCNKTLPSSEQRHRCKAKNIQYLMRFKGWKRCPGCLTPVLKESGCNHMTCSAPGCNVHFCYKCGGFIVDTSQTGGVGTSISEHYSKCRQFDRSWSDWRQCTIM